MQLSVDKLSSAWSSFGLTISTKKTEVLYQPAPGKSYTEPNIFINGNKINTVSHFTYLGSTLSQKANIDDEVNSRISKASAAFGRLHDSVWNRRGISTQTKLKVYRAVVLPTLLYACETWTVYQRHARLLNHFHTKSLRKILNIKWQEKVPDTEILARSGLPSIHTSLMQSQLRWAGHVVRMPDHRLPKRLFYGELTEGHRARGGPRKRYKDALKTALKAFDIGHDSWEAAARNRAHWGSMIWNGASVCEANRQQAAKLKHQVRKDRIQNPPEGTASISCPTCGRLFRAKIGLISHQRTHVAAQQI